MAQQSTKEYEVEKILDRKRIGKTILYLVLWKGGSNEDATWQPIYHLSRCERAIRQYQSKQSANRQKQSKMKHFTKKVYGKNKPSNKIEAQLGNSRYQSGQHEDVKKIIQDHSRSRQKKRISKSPIVVGQKKYSQRRRKQKIQKETVSKLQNANTMNNLLDKPSKNASKKIVYTLNLSKNKNKSVKIKQKSINIEQHDNQKLLQQEPQQLIDEKLQKHIEKNINKKMMIQTQKKENVPNLHGTIKFKETQQFSEEQKVLSQIVKINKEQSSNISLSQKTLEPYITSLKKKKEPQFRIDYAQQIHKAIACLAFGRGREINPYIDKYNAESIDQNDKNLYEDRTQNPSQILASSLCQKRHKKEKASIIKQLHFE